MKSRKEELEVSLRLFFVFSCEPDVGSDSHDVKERERETLVSMTRVTGLDFLASSSLLLILQFPQQESQKDFY
jgi:hypothetical protein